MERGVYRRGRTGGPGTGGKGGSSGRGAGATRAGAVLALAAVMVAGCGGPWGPLPGGRLAGEEAACPDAGFAFAAEVRETAVEVRPDDPWSVTTWNVVHEGALYLSADFLPINPVKRWPHLLVADPRVRVRVGSTVYACRATREHDLEVVRALREAAAGKYALDPDGMAAQAEVWWFRVHP